MLSNPTRLTPYYHPTTVLIIDDDRGLVDSVTLSLSDDYICLAHGHPGEALAHIQHSRNVYASERACALAFPNGRRADRNAGLSERPTFLDLSDMPRIMTNDNRFGEISVAIVDYDLPYMHGIDFCSLLKNTQIKTILLTAKASGDTALEAFNDNVIDMFLRKQDPDVLNKLAAGVAALQGQYIQDKCYSNTSVIDMSALDEKGLDFLFDEHFIDYFRSVCEGRGVVEYYYSIDPKGLQIVGADGQLGMMLVCHRRDLKDHRHTPPPAGDGRQVPWSRAGQPAPPQAWFAAEPVGDWLCAVVERGAFPSAIDAPQESLHTFRDRDQDWRSAPGLTA